MDTDVLNRVGSTRTAATKIAAGAAALFAVSFFTCVASVNVPHKASADALLTWWQKDSSQSAGITSMFCAIATAISFIVVIDYVRALVAARAAGYARLTQFAHSMAVAFTGTMLVSAALRGVIGHLVKVDDEPLPGLDVLRYSTSLNYTMIGTVAMSVLAASMIAISVVVLKTTVLARYVGISGVVVGVIIAGASAISMGQYTIALSLLWALGLSVAIWRGPSPT